MWAIAKKVQVLEIDTYKLVLCGGRVLLHDVLYTSEIQWNLASVISLIKHGFNLNFHDTGVDFFKQIIMDWVVGIMVLSYLMYNQIMLQVFLIWHLLVVLVMMMNVWHSILGHIG